MRAMMAYVMILTSIYVFCGHSVAYSDSPNTSAAPSVSNPPPPPVTAVQNNPVNGGGGEAMTDIIDIKPPEKIGFDYRILKYLLMAVGVLLLVGLLFFIIDYVIRKRKKAVLKEDIMLPPHILAYQMLDKLEMESGIEEKEYYFKLTAIIRGYLAGRYGIDALEMTTEELIPRINDISVEKKLGTCLKDLLKSTDPVKFAGISTGVDKMKKDLFFTREFIDKTYIIPEETKTGNGLS